MNRNLEDYELPTEEIQKVLDSDEISKIDKTQF